MLINIIAQLIISTCLSFACCAVLRMVAWCCSKLLSCLSLMYGFTCFCLSETGCHTWIPHPIRGNYNPWISGFQLSNIYKKEKTFVEHIHFDARIGTNGCSSPCVTGGMCCPCFLNKLGTCITFEGVPWTYMYNLLFPVC